MTVCFDEFIKLKPVIETNKFDDMIERYKFYWESLQYYELADNLSIVGKSSSELIVPSFNRAGKFTRLLLERTGECACVKYQPSSSEANLQIFVDRNNKIKAIKSYESDDNTPVLDLFISTDIIRFFHIVIPKSDLEEILFQVSTIITTDLSFLKELI